MQNPGQEGEPKRKLSYGDIADRLLPDGVERLTSDALAVLKKYPHLEEPRLRVLGSIASIIFKEKRIWIQQFEPEDQGELKNEVVMKWCAFAGMAIFRALDWAEWMDTLAGDERHHTNFFIQSLLERQAGEELLNIVRYSPPGDHTRGIPVEDAEANVRAIAIHLIGERLRRGEQLSQVLSMHSDQILYHAKEGDDRFFVSLASLIQKHHANKLVLSFEAWLRTAWLPLALWNASPDAAVKRLDIYRELLLSNGMRVPSKQTPTAMKMAIRRFRKRLREKRAD